MENRLGCKGKFWCSKRTMNLCFYPKFLLKPIRQGVILKFIETAFLLLGVQLRINYNTKMNEEGTMKYQSYINVTNDFVKGIGEYLQKNQIPLDEVVEVFAGDGKLGLQLGLRKNDNVSDLLLFANNDYKDDVNENWTREPEGVVAESAYETVIRFSAKKNRIRVLLMGAPPPANSYYCPSYDVLKALHYCFDGEILYIGEINSFYFASPKFFKHVEVVEEDSFNNLVVKNYDNSTGYFTSQWFEKPVEVQPHLLKFKPCMDKTCDCLDPSKISKDVLSYTESMVK